MVGAIMKVIVINVSVIAVISVKVAKSLIIVLVNIVTTMGIV